MRFLHGTCTYQDVSEVLLVAFILGFLAAREKFLSPRTILLLSKESQTFHSINVDKSTGCRLIAAPFIDGRDRHDRAPFLEFMARRFYVDFVREELLPVV